MASKATKARETVRRLPPTRAQRRAEIEAEHERKFREAERLADMVTATALASVEGETHLSFDPEGNADHADAIRAAVKRVAPDADERLARVLFGKARDRFPRVYRKQWTLDELAGFFAPTGGKRS